MSAPVVVSRIQNRRGTQTQFNALYPPGYAGVGGYGSIPGFNSTNFPNVLMPGELALVTDTRRSFIGNLNGEYIELAELTAGGEFLEPLVIPLPPAALWTIITPLTIELTASPFNNILYSITDNPSPNWDSVGTNFSRNGELQITSTVPFAPILNPPFPPITPVTLTDTGTEINTVLPNSISFMAQYNITNTQIEILYMHDFAGPLTFSTNTVKWIPFV
jgi:hypothetical protein